MKLSYDALSPFTDRKRVLIEYDDLHGESRICMDTGYQYSEKYISGSEACDFYEQVCPKMVKESKFIDSDERVWYKSVIISPTNVLYPDMYDGDWIWKVGKWKRVIDDTESVEEAAVTLVVGEDVFVVDDVHSLIFEENEFETALDNFYLHTDDTN